MSEPTLPSVVKTNTEMDLGETGAGQVSRLLNFPFISVTWSEAMCALPHHTAIPVHHGSGFFKFVSLKTNTRADKRKKRAGRARLWCQGRSVEDRLSQTRRDEMARRRLTSLLRTFITETAAGVPREARTWQNSISSIRPDCSRDGHREIARLIRPEGVQEQEIRELNDLVANELNKHNNQITGFVTNDQEP